MRIHSISKQMFNELTRAIWNKADEDLKSRYDTSMIALRDALVASLSKQTASSIRTPRGNIVRAVSMLCNELCMRTGFTPRDCDKRNMCIKHAESYIDKFVSAVSSDECASSLWMHYDTLCAQLDELRRKIRSEIKKYIAECPHNWKSAISRTLYMDVGYSSSDFTLLASVYQELLLSKFYNDQSTPFVCASVLTQDHMNVYNHGVVGILYDYEAMSNLVVARPCDMYSLLAHYGDESLSLQHIADLLLANLSTLAFTTQLTAIVPHYVLNDDMYLCEPPMEDFLSRIPDGQFSEFLLHKPISPAGFFYMSSISNSEKAYRLEHLGLGLNLPVFCLDQVNKKITRVR